MKKILNFVCILALCMGAAHGAVRDGDAVARGGTQKSTQQRVATTVNSERSATRIAAPRTSSVSSRGATNTTSVKSRAASAVVNRAATNATQTRTALRSTNTNASRTSTARAANSTPIPTRGNTVSAVARAAVNRAAIDESSAAMAQTRVGAEYEQCKAAYFACMDQFCQLKNDDYRRCSCSNRVLDLIDKRQTLTDAGQQLTTFTENLDVVGMTAAQASAMRTASEGENALGADGSASKALLTAIMNSIRGEDATVGGKMSDLNSINISFDTTNAFGTADAGQIIATYNGKNLYSAVYPQCRNAVAADCNDASLQRAITAYLMAVEQDCNTVQTAIETTQKQMKSAVREGSAMLDLARVENRKNHNSSDMTTCIAEIESAVLSNEVCGDNYRKCLDNGEFIDITTGSPIAGVSNFYELENLLTFASNVDAADQQLSKISTNRTFVQNFESRVKKFAQPALDKCVENADDVWAQYLDKALLDIYYAQKSKVAEIKQGCFDFVAACYMNADSALTTAMKEIASDSALVLQPDRIALTAEVCSDYVTSCSNMFKGDIIAEYINNVKGTDATTACRAVAQQCFAKFGGAGYENFYYPYSGISKSGAVMDWFSLYDITKLATNNTCSNGEIVVDGTYCATYRSECAKQLQQISACSDPAMIEKVFGGMDYVQNEKLRLNGQNESVPLKADSASGATFGYGRITEGQMSTRDMRSTGVATEVYNQIMDTLTTQCMNLYGRFVPANIVRTSSYNPDDYCVMNLSKNSEYATADPSNGVFDLVSIYGLLNSENMCPRDYKLRVDTQSWGACLCWENGGRRSKNGTSTTCMAVRPRNNSDGDVCAASKYSETCPATGCPNNTAWCVLMNIQDNQVCPSIDVIDDNTGGCNFGDGKSAKNLPAGV